MELIHTSIAVLEYSSIIRGLYVVDVAIKRAPVMLLRAAPVSQGRFALLFSGGATEVEEAHVAAIDASGDSLVENALIAQVTRGLAPAIGGKAQPPAKGAAIGMLESSSIAAAVEAANCVMKSGSVALNRFHLGKGLGGKSYFVFSGELKNVQACLKAGQELLEAKGRLLGSELIARPHAEFLEVV